jgi:tetratricopeptide (TPR) repeat protein
MPVRSSAPIALRYSASIRAWAHTKLIRQTYAEFEPLKRELIAPSLSRHEGRLIKTTGDGALAEFASPLAAVRCAVELQDHLASGGSPLRLRVGLNLGDVIVGQDGDLYGDGITIAVRLEGITDPGGILIREGVQRSRRQVGRWLRGSRRAAAQERMALQWLDENLARRSETSDRAFCTCDAPKSSWSVAGRHSKRDAHAHFFLGRYDEAASWAAMALQDNPDFQAGVRISAASNAIVGRPEQAHEAVVRLQRLNPTLRVSNLKDVLGTYRRAEDLARYEEGLRKAGLPD